MHTGTENKDLSLAREFKNNLEEEHRQNGVIDQGESKKNHGKKMDRKKVSCSGSCIGGTQRCENVL